MFDSNLYIKIFLYNKLTTITDECFFSLFAYSYVSGKAMKAIDVYQALQEFKHVYIYTLTCAYEATVVYAIKFGHRQDSLLKFQKINE